MCNIVCSSLQSVSGEEKILDCKETARLKPDIMFFSSVVFLRSAPPLLASGNFKSERIRVPGLAAVPT